MAENLLRFLSFIIDEALRHATLTVNISDQAQPGHNRDVLGLMVSFDLAADSAMWETTYRSRAGLCPLHDSGACPTCTRMAKDAWTRQAVA